MRPAWRSASVVGSGRSLAPPMKVSAGSAEEEREQMQHWSDIKLKESSPRQGRQPKRRPAPPRCAWTLPPHACSTATHLPAWQPPGPPLQTARLRRIESGPASHGVHTRGARVGLTSLGRLKTAVWPLPSAFATSLADVELTLAARSCPGAALPPVLQLGQFLSLPQPYCPATHAQTSHQD